MMYESMTEQRYWPASPVDGRSRVLPVRHYDGVVMVAGEQDVSTIDALCGELLEAITRDEEDVTLDLSEVTFLDSSVVHLLLRTDTLLRAESRSFYLRTPSRVAERVLRLCGAIGPDRLRISGPGRAASSTGAA